MISKPINLTFPFAIAGDKDVIPDANDPQTGRFSQRLGFPPITSLPIAQGGIAPYREDFNAALYMLACHIFWKQSGGMYEYDEKLDYPEMSIVTLEKKYWQCLSDNGPGHAVGPKSPLSEPDYWREIKFGDVTVDGPGQGLKWAISATEKLWTQADIDAEGGIVATTPGDQYTNHQDDPQIEVGKTVQLPPGGTWWVTWMEVKSTPTQDGGWDDSLGMTILKACSRAYRGETVFSPTNPDARIILDAWRIV